MRKYLMKCKVSALSFGIAEVVTAIENVLLAYVFQFIVAIAARETNRTIKDGILVVLGYLIFTLVFGFIFYFCKERFRCRFMGELREDIFNHFMARKFAKYYKNNTGEYISVINNDLRLIEQNAVLPIFNIIQHTATLLLALYSIWRVNRVLAPVLLLVAIGTMFFGKVYSVGLSEASDAYMNESAEYQNKIKDAFQGFEVIHNFGILGIIQKKHAGWSQSLEQKRYGSNIRMDRAACLSNFTNLSIQTLTFVVCGYLALKGRLTISQITLLSSLTNQLFYPLFEIVDAMNCYRSTAAIRKRIAEITQDEEETERLNATALKKEIRFKDVSFGYEEDKFILKNLNIVFEQGKKYAIIGASGSGKSTILRLLLRYYDNYTGEIVWDGQDISTFSEESLRTNCSFIPQNIFLFDDTLYNNITLYKEYPYESIMAAIRKAGLENMVNRLENGLETRVTENGNNFSGGEKQRIAVARALLTGNKLILMDEATANLDSDTAASVEEIILQEKEVTCISVIHHFIEKNMHYFDKVFVIRDGKVEEAGTYEELRSKNVI